MADLNPLPDIHQAAVLRSPHAHARIVRIDVNRALQMPGVVAIVTGRDVEKWMKPFSVVADHAGSYYPIAIEKVRYVGEPVAVVVARDRYAAEDALNEIDVEYTALPAVVDVEEAATDRVLLHEEAGTNVAIHRQFTYGDVDGAFAGADVVIRDRFEFNRFTGMPLETYGIVAHWDLQDNSATVWCNFQGPFSMHVVMAAALRIPPNQLRVIVPEDVGGGFGIKIAIYPYVCLLVVVSRIARVPVKWIEDRHENLIGSSSGTDRVTYVELAARADGTVTGVRFRFLDNVGAYLRAPEPGTLFRPFGNYTGAYRVRNIALDLAAVVTNKVPTGPNRGYSCGQLYHALEGAMDQAARALAMDPAEIRAKNLLQPHQFPYVTPTGGYYDVGNFPAVFETLLSSAQYEELRRARDAGRREGRWMGIGLCVAVDPSASNMGYMSIGNTPEDRKRELPKSGTGEAATVSIDWGGRVTVTLNTAPQGQGHITVASQIVADEFGCLPDDVLVTTGSDTGTRAWTIASGAYSSRFAATAANAILMACRELKEKLRSIAAHLLNCPANELEFDGSSLYNVRHPDATMSIKRLAGTVHWNPSVLPVGITPGLTHTAYFSIESARPAGEKHVNSSGVYSFGADLTLIEVDRKTYDVRILKYYMAHDIGRVLNPQIVEGQLYGGAFHGLAGALFEELAYDENGQIITGTLMDYVCPTSAESIELHIEHLETPSIVTPLGARGTGEVATMTLPAAISNAVTDALEPLGVSMHSLPLTPSRIFAAIQGVGQ